MLQIHQSPIRAEAVVRETRILYVLLQRKCTDELCFIWVD